MIIIIMVTVMVIVMVIKVIYSLESCLRSIETCWVPKFDPIGESASVFEFDFSCSFIIAAIITYYQTPKLSFLATLVALHFNPVSN